MTNVTAPQFQTDANNFAEVTNGDINTTVTMRLGQDVDSVAKTINNINNRGNAAIDELNKSRGFRVAGTFAAGFTYELSNDVGMDAAGNPWIFVDSANLPFTVSAGTTPAAPTYQQVAFSDHNATTNRNATNSHDGIYTRNFNSVADLRSQTSSDGTVVDFSLMAGSRVNVLGRNAASDGGSFWGVIKSGSSTDDDFSVFTIGTGVYVEANTKGTVRSERAGLFGGATDSAKLTNLIEKSDGKVRMSKDATYELTSQVDINNNGTELDLNGSTLNFTLGLGVSGVFDKGDSNEVHNGTITVDYTPGSGGNGHAGAALTVGNQGTGAGQKGFNYHNLTVSTNRTDAGAHISLLGENRLGKIQNIKVPDNSVCRNIIGIEWGGTTAGTGHPHNIDVKNIDIGAITTPTYGSSGFAYGVWCSGGFNIKVKNITMESGHGLMMFIAGDNGAEYAPSEYKQFVGTNASLENGTIKSFYGFAVRCVGSGSGIPASNRLPMNLKVNGLRAIGGKVGANNNFGIQAEFCDGPEFRNINISGALAGGATLGADAKNVTFEGGSIEDSELYGIQLGSASGKSINPKVISINFKNNNSLGGAGSGTSAVTINNSDQAVVQYCSFGEEGETETQRYSIFTASTANRPKIMNNHTYVNDNSSIDPYLSASASIYEVDNTKDF